MLPAIKRVRDEVVKQRQNGRPLNLETLANIFTMCSPVDEIEYISYDVPPTNPIWGMFSKWEVCKPYAVPATQTRCKIQYASHLDDVWRLFVVCKELCHSLYTHDGSHSITNSSVVELVNTLALSSAISETDVQNISPFVAEKLAEFGALEIIVPVGIRLSMIADGSFNNKSKLADISSIIECPECYVEFIYRQSIIDFSLKVLGPTPHLLPSLSTSDAE